MKLKSLGTLFLLTGFVFLLLVVGSSAWAQTPDAPNADPRVKVAHFAPFANTLAGTSVTVRVNGADALTDFRFGDITSYISLPPGNTLVEIIPTGTTTVAISDTFMLAADTDYTLAAIGNGSLQPLELFAMLDDNTAPGSGANLRVGHLAPFAANLVDTEVDICTDGGTVFLDDVPYKAVTAYLNLPADDYDLKIAAPDNTCSTVFLDIPSVRLADGGVYDVFAIGDLANQPLQTASGTGLTLSPAARVNVAHFAPFANTLAGTSVTVRVNGADALTDFQFGELTGYLDFEPSDHFIEIIPTGTSTVAISTTVNLNPATDYTLAAIGNGSLQPLELFAMLDDNTAPGSGANLRVGHLAPFAANLVDTEVDICTESGSVVGGLTNVPYKGVSGYLNLPAGAYDLKIAAPGTSCATTIIDIPIFYLNDGDVGSVFAIGDVANQAPYVVAYPDVINRNRIHLPFIINN